MKELEQRLGQFNINRPGHRPNYRNHFSEDQERLLLKVPYLSSSWSWNKIEYCIQIHPFNSNAMYVSCWTLECNDFIYCLVGDVWCFLPQLLPKRLSGWGECPQRNVGEWPTQHSYGKTTGFYYKSTRNFYIKLKFSGRFYVWQYFEIHLRDCLSCRWKGYQPIRDCFINRCWKISSGMLGLIQRLLLRKQGTNSLSKRHRYVSYIPFYFTSFGIIFCGQI